MWKLNGKRGGKMIGECIFVVNKVRGKVIVYYDELVVYNSYGIG